MVGGGGKGRGQEGKESYSDTKKETSETFSFQLLVLKVTGMVD